MKLFLLKYDYFDWVVLVLVFRTLEYITHAVFKFKHKVDVDSRNLFVQVSVFVCIISGAKCVISALFSQIYFNIIKLTIIYNSLTNNYDTFFFKNFFNNELPACIVSRKLKHCNYEIETSQINIK